MSDKAAVPKKVWNTSTSFPGLSPIPPNSSSWQLSIYCSNLSKLIRSALPIAYQADIIHHEYHTSGSFSGRPLNPPCKVCLWLSQMPRVSISTKSRSPRIARAPMHQNVYAAWLSASGTAPNAPSILLHLRTNSLAFLTSIKSILLSSVKQEIAVYENLESPENDPSSF